MAKIALIRLTTQIDQFFTRAKSGAIWGRVYFEVGEGLFFPNQEWTDLVVAFEKDWLRTTLALADREFVSASVPFYDGPFRVEMTATDNGIVDLRFLRVDDIRYTGRANIHDLLDNALTVASQLISNCIERKWSNDDTDDLATLIDRAARHIKQNRDMQ